MINRLFAIVPSALAILLATFASGRAATVEAHPSRLYRWGPTGHSLSLSIEPESAIVRSHQDIKLWVAIKNFGPDISASVTGHVSEYKFVVTRSDGSVIAPNAKDRHIWTGSVPMGWHIAHGMTFQTQVYLDSIYDLAPGTYHVVAHTSVTLEGQAAPYATLTSNEVVITVTP